MDIAIMGGGIYGLSLAWALARNGYLATVIGGGAPSGGRRVPLQPLALLQQRVFR
jgi:glycine/D-amino acid oxidase-like deaminating enzyme